MARIFVDKELDVGNQFALNVEDSHHLKNVLRMRKNSLVQIVDGRKREFTAEIFEDTGKQLILIIREHQNIRREPQLQISVFQGLPKGDKMEQVIMRCTEIGASSFIPVIMQRSVVNLNQQKAVKKQRRWQKIAYSAACQSLRQTVPIVREVQSFGQMIESLADYDEVILLYEGEDKQTLYDLNLKSIKKVAVIVGPEGGLTQSEADCLKSCGSRSISLGPRILRTETAAIAVISILLYCSGDLRGISNEKM